MKSVSVLKTGRLCAGLAAVVLSGVLMAAGGNGPYVAGQEEQGRPEQEKPKQTSGPATADGENELSDEDRAALRLQPRRDEQEPLKPVPKPLQKMLDEAVSLNPVNTVYLDKPNGRVLLRTQVACDFCPLEMLCCLEETKEHESILSLRAKAETVNIGMLALGLKKGSPAQTYPKFVAPKGRKLDLFVNWVGKDGKLQRATAQSWVRRSVSYYSVSYTHLTLPTKA